MGPSIRDAVLLLQREYACLPGLRLTLLQAQRLVGMDAISCEAMLGALEDAGIVERTAEGHFVRRGASGGRSGGRAARRTASRLRAA